MSALAAAIAQGVTCFNPALVTCVDCGLRTGRFCDGDEVMGPDGRWSGRPCFAVDTVGAVNAAGQEIPNGQRTPLCSECCHKAFLKFEVEQCHFCRGIPWATPPPQ